MKNMNKQYFMILTFLAVGLSDINAKSGSQKPSQTAPQAAAAQAPKLPAQQIADLKETMNDLQSAKRELKVLQKELPDPKAPKANSDAMAKIKPKDLSSTLKATQKLETDLKKLQSQLPGAQKKGLMTSIKQNDVSKALEQLKELNRNIPLLQKELSGGNKRPDAIIQATAVDYVLLVSLLAVIAIVALDTLGSQISTTITDY